MTAYLIPADLAEAVLNYLARRPYIEVHAMIAALQTLPKAKEDGPVDPQA